MERGKKVTERRTIYERDRGGEKVDTDEGGGREK